MCPCDEETTDLVLLYMGFLQKQGRVNGMVKLYLRILGELRAHRPNARVEIYKWDADPDDRAEFILQTLPKNRKIRIVIVGFSYGGYTAKLLTGTLHWGLNAQQAVSLPNFGSLNGPTLLEAKGFPASTVDALKARGHDVREMDMTSGLQAIERTPTGWFGGADPRREGLVLGD